MSDSESNGIEEWNHSVQVHATLMISGWIVFIPIGVLASLLLRHRNQHPKYPFLYLHYSCQTVGLVLAIIGWMIAIRKFHVFDSFHSKQAAANEDHNGIDGEKENSTSTMFLVWTISKTSHIHAVVGTIVMYGAILNVLIYPLCGMKKPQRANESFAIDYTLRRKIGHMTHRIIGHILVILAFVTCWTGTQIQTKHSIATNVVRYNKEYILALIVPLGVTMIFGIDKLKCYYRNHNAHHRTRDNNGDEEIGRGENQKNDDYPLVTNESSSLLA